MRPMNRLEKIWTALAVAILVLAGTITLVVMAGNDEPEHCAALRQDIRANVDIVYQVWESGQRALGEPTTETEFIQDYGKTPAAWKQDLYDQSAAALPQAGCHR